MFKRSAINTNYSLVLHNRFVLYFMLFLAGIHVLVHLTKNDMAPIAVFFLVGIVTSFFNKNMIIIICVALVVPQILKIGHQPGAYEGFEDSPDATPAATADEEPKEAPAPAPAPAAAAPKPKTISDADVKRMKLMTDQYAKLLEVQNKLKTGFDSVTQSVADVKQITDGLQEGLRGKRDK